MIVPIQTVEPLRHQLPPETDETGDVGGAESPLVWDVHHDRVTVHTGGRDRHVAGGPFVR
jgi:hypothetical protein